MIDSAANVNSTFDVFNGDADGICALHQMRLAYPREATLITGVKRDIALLERVPCETKADVTVLDVSLDVNVEPLRRILDAGGRVVYFDHHSAQQAFHHPRLHLNWDGAPDACTSILVDRHLQGRFRKWAVVAAFGDNLSDSARTLARTAGISASETEAFDELGRFLNYNAYGDSVEDLHVAPDALYRELHSFAEPRDFIDESPCYRLLADAYRNDSARMENLRPAWISADSALYILPCEPWARRVSGIFANQLATQWKGRSFAILTQSPGGEYVVSVRSGNPKLCGADVFCAQFPSGGGRAAAAGINALPASDLDRFARAFSEYFAAGAAHAN